MFRIDNVIVLLLCAALAGAALAATGDDAGTPPAPSSGQAAEPTAEQIDAWLAAGRALKAERPELFDGAEGVLATMVLPDGQGAAAGIRPGDVLIRYGETPLDGAQQLIALTGETPPEQAVTLRWLRPAPPDDPAGAQALDAGIRGGRIGVGIRDLADTPEARMQALLDAGREAWHRADYPRALGAFEDGLEFARATGHRGGEADFTYGIGVILTHLDRYQQALEHHTQALAILRENGNRAGEGNLLGSIGAVYWSLGRYSEALEHHTEALAIHREIGDRRGEGADLTNIGLVYAALGQYPEALKHHIEALGSRREIGDRAGEGDSLNNIGIVYASNGRYPEALERFTQSLAVRREIGDRRGEGKNLTNIASVYADLGRYDQSLEHHTQALAILREIGDRRSEGATLNNIGLVYGNLGRWQEALEQGTQALAILREIGDRAGEGRTLGNIGNVYESVGRYSEALERYTKAFAIFREIGDRAGEGAALNNIGNVYKSLGRYPEALEHYTQALAILREIGDRAGEGAVLFSIGAVYRDLGSYEEALEHLASALTISRVIAHRQVEGHTLNGIGIVYATLGRHQEALENCTLALAIHREIGNRRGEGAGLGNIGVVYNDLGRYEEALEHHTQSLALSREIGDRAGEGASLSNIGNAYANLSRYPEALENYAQALAIHRDIGDRSSEAKDLGNLGVLAARQGDPDAAAAYYRQGLTLQAELNDPEALWLSWNNLRLLWETQSQPGPAILAGKRAVNTIQAMRAASSGLDQTLQQSFLQDKEDVYRNLADLLLAQDRPAEAQQVLDMLKEQEFYDYIQEDDAHDPRTTRAAFNRFEADWNAGYDGIAEPLPALGERIAALSRIDASARTAEEQAELERLTAERDAATAELERLLAGLPEHFAAIDPAQQAEANEALANAPGNKRALLAALSEQSGQPTGLLQFILLGNKVRLLLTTPEDWHTAVVEVDADTLNNEIDALRTALTDSGSDATTPAKALYTRLVAPIAEAIDAAGLQSLLVHLDGKLRYIPFAALHDGEQWLAERWSLVYYTAASERQPEAAGGGDWRVAGLGVSEPRGKFIQLPAVAQEIDGIVREDDSDPKGVLPGRALLNTAFSETALRTEAADPANRILHLASHFDLHPGSDADSSLLLGTVTDDGEPHTLSLKALRESKPPLDLRHIDLVTLSACNTFMGGADDTGVEIEGMGTIIQRQGARGVLASLWPVADASTGVLMQTFYRLRAERPDLTKAQALQQAQLGLLRGEQAPEAASGCAGDRRPIDVGGGDGSPGAAAQAVADAACGWRHPFYWAPFVLMGNWL